MTEVRTFTPPQPLGERLSDPSPAPTPVGSAVPRSLPEIPELAQPRRNSPPRLSGDYTRVPMATYKDSKSNGGITFSSQDKLPKLPIPELEASCKRYLEALKPLQSAREHAETQHAVNEFLKSDGPELQEKLKTYAQGKTSYIEQFCTQQYHSWLPQQRANLPRV